jgi:hypothetical protein
MAAQPAPHSVYLEGTDCTVNLRATEIEPGPSRKSLQPHQSGEGYILASRLGTVFLEARLCMGSHMLNHKIFANIRTLTCFGTVGLWLLLSSSVSTYEYLKWKKHQQKTASYYHYIETILNQ